MGHGLQGVLSDDEHPGEDLFAFSLSDKQDIHLSSNWVASNFELDPGATFAFQVDQLDEGGAGAPGGVQPDTTRHAIAINQTAAQQLRPRSLAITKVGRCQGAFNRGRLFHHRAEALMRTRYSLLAGTPVRTIPQAVLAVICRGADVYSTSFTTCAVRSA